ncbi:MAG TPA: hypothetical protein VFW05_13425 [Verrucomicrobiae bacterium]|nr:hypothetical protein [Verrucomicrobiae bacterium]
MYAKVPPELKAPLLKELRQLRLRSTVRHFPALLLIFSLIITLLMIVKGHAVLEMFRDYLRMDLSDGKLIVVMLLLITSMTATVLVYFLRQDYRDCDCQECLYCADCNAVDKFDSGYCPVCRTPLTEKESFYFTTAKDEQKVLERWGLQASRDG